MTMAWAAAQSTQEGWAAAWRAAVDWVQHLTQTPWQGSDDELVAEIIRLKYTYGQLSAAEMLQSNSGDVGTLHWLMRRCKNVKACAKRLHNQGPLRSGNLPRELQLEQQWHRVNLRHIRFLPPNQRPDDQWRLFISVEEASSYTSVEEARAALHAAQTASWTAYLRLRTSTRALLRRFEVRQLSPGRTGPLARQRQRQRQWLTGKGAAEVGRVEEVEGEEPDAAGEQTVRLRHQDHMVRLFELQLVRLEILRELNRQRGEKAAAGLAVEELGELSLEDKAADMARKLERASWNPRDSHAPESDSDDGLDDGFLACDIGEGEEESDSEEDLGWSLCFKCVHTVSLAM